MGNLHAIPEVHTAEEIGREGVYRCPLCRVQTTRDPADPGWVFCPMVDHEPICLGCCIDHQKAARARDFAAHPLSDLFTALSRRTGRPVDDLRRVCLVHQASLLGEGDHELRAAIQLALRQAPP